MKWREFIAGVGGSVAWPAVARAQRLVGPVLGYLSGGSCDSEACLLTAFHRGLRQAGYIEGQNVTIEYRWAEGRFDRLQRWPPTSPVVKSL